MVLTAGVTNGRTVRPLGIVWCGARCTRALLEAVAVPLSVSQTRVMFGLFEADLASGELWKNGFRVKLQGQPFRVLALLLEHPGEVVSRERAALAVVAL